MSLLPCRFQKGEEPLITYWDFDHPPRPVQEHILQQVDDLGGIDGNSAPTVVLCDGPTGSGKSAINIAIAHRESGIILTPQKTLQDQMARDWPWLPILKGGQNYTCSDFGGLDCKQGRAAGCRAGNCDYKTAVYNFLRAPVAITNYAYFFSAMKADFSPEHRFVICDECHMVEQSLIGAATVSIDHSVYKVLEDFSEPWPTSYEECINFCFAMRSPVVVRLQELSELLNPGDGRRVVDKAAIRDHMILTEWDSALAYLVSSIEEETWIYTSVVDNQAFSLRPLYAKRLFTEKLLPMNKKFFMTSATIPPTELLNRWLDLPKDTARITVDSPFSLENRRVYAMPVAHLNYQNMSKALPAIAARIDKILSSKSYANVKGIIHCNSYKLTQQIADLLPQHRRRLLVHSPDMDRQKLLERHISSSGPTILMSPSMTEGVDLFDDLSRLTIIPKLPYPYLGDPWTKARQEDDEDWYGWQTLQTIIQGVGRSVRHAEDWADTFVLDSSFLGLWSRSGHFAPKWFSDSIIW